MRYSPDEVVCSIPSTLPSVAGGTVPSPAHGRRAAAASHAGRRHAAPTRRAAVTASIAVAALTGHVTAIRAVITPTVSVATTTPRRRQAARTLARPTTGRPGARRAAPALRALALAPGAGTCCNGELLGGLVLGERKRQARLVLVLGVKLVALRSDHAQRRLEGGRELYVGGEGRCGAARGAFRDETQVLVALEGTEHLCTIHDHRGSTSGHMLPPPRAAHVAR